MKETKLITLATLAVLALNVSAKDFSSEELQQRMLERRAVEAVIWGMTIFKLGANRQAYFRDGHAKYCDIYWGPKRAHRKYQPLTANTIVVYMYILFDTLE